MAGFVFFKLIVQQIVKGNLSAIQNVKYYNRWKMSMQPGHNSVVDRLPWLTFPAIRILEQRLTETAKVFEYGGGGSTLFFLDKAGAVVTVEHNKEWFDVLKKKITGPESRQWEAALILPEERDPKVQLDFTNPNHYYSNDENYPANTFKSYACYIDKFEDGYFDIVLIDGRARPSCLKHAVSKVKKGGLLILDNAERKYYLANNLIDENQFRLILNKPAPIPFMNFYSQTNIWVRQ
jgi:hypothetical protein